MKINNETYIEDRFIKGVQSNRDSTYLPLLIRTDGILGYTEAWTYFNMGTVSNRILMANKVVKMLEKRGK